MEFVAVKEWDFGSAWKTTLTWPSFKPVSDWVSDMSC